MAIGTSGVSVWYFPALPAVHVLACVYGSETAFNDLNLRDTPMS